MEEHLDPFVSKLLLVECWYLSVSISLGSCLVLLFDRLVENFHSVLNRKLANNKIGCSGLVYSSSAVISYFN